MGPVEYVFLILWIIFGIVGWVRSFSRELGITIVILGALLIINELRIRVAPALESSMGNNAGAILVGLYTTILIIAVLIAYQGQTLTFSGPTTSDIFGVTIGLINGWLVIGTIWYFINKYNYPLLGLQGGLSNLANTLLKFTPFAFVPGEQMRLILLAGLVFLIFLRVVR